MPGCQPGTGMGKEYSIQDRIAVPLIERHVCSQDGNRRDKWQQKRWTAFDKTTRYACGRKGP